MANDSSQYYQVITTLINDAKTARSDRGAKWRAYYDFKKKYILATNIVGRDGRILFSRDIDYGFAITAHKSQGSTYDTVFVDVNDMVYDRYGWSHRYISFRGERIYENPFPKEKSES